MTVVITEHMIKIAEYVIHLWSPLPWLEGRVDDRRTFALDADGLLPVFDTRERERGVAKEGGGV